MEYIFSKKYATFLEETMQRMVRMPVSGICILLKLEDGSVCSDYFNSKMMDKMIYAGVIQQDVTMDMLKANSMLGNTDESE